MESSASITFLFTDIEHSTRLAQRLKEQYPALLNRHRGVIRHCVEKYDGLEIDVAGDGFFIAFTDPGQAVKAALQIQEILHRETWATEVGLKIRMGIHCGEALEAERGYTGVEVHRAARICDAAYGGQVLVSGNLKSALNGQSRDDPGFVLIGEFILKDFLQPIALYQLRIPGLRQTFPSPRVRPLDLRLAIMPFDNLNADPAQQYFCEGIAEELIIALGKVQGLRVVSRASTFAIANERLDVQQIGEKLNAMYILKGAVRKRGDQRIVSAELIDAKSATNIWSARYDNQFGNILQIQDEIARQISDTLRISLFPEQRHSIQERQSSNIEAYDSYLRGRRFYAQFSARGIQFAMQMFQKAIRTDPDYALAYAGLADCYAYMVQHLNCSSDTVEKAKEASRKAISINPLSAEANTSLGIALSLDQKLDASEQAFQQAIESDPTSFQAWFHYGRMCFSTGNPEKAARLFLQAHRADPDDYQSIFLAAQVYGDLGSEDLANQLRQEGIRIAANILGLNPGDTRALYLSANAYAQRNERQKSKSLLQRALALEPRDSMLLYNAGCIYALLNMEKEALNCLERAYEAGLTFRGWYENDSNLDSLRGHPRFIALLEEMAGDA